jgi:hypothetical protein
MAPFKNSLLTEPGQVPNPSQRISPLQRKIGNAPGTLSILLAGIAVIYILGADAF